MQADVPLASACTAPSLVASVSCLGLHVLEEFILHSNSPSQVPSENSERQPDHLESSDGEDPCMVSAVSLWSFSRSPASFRQVLHMCPRLASCVQLLEDNGYPSELKSGAKLFVHPEQYEAVTQAIKDYDLRASHIIVAQDLEDSVTAAIQSLPKKHKVYFRDAQDLHLDHAKESLDADNTAPDCDQEPLDPNVVTTAGICVQVIVKRTFIHLELPSSMLSRSCGNRTNSTTNAAIRGRAEGKNPRCL